MRFATPRPRSACATRRSLIAGIGALSLVGLSGCQMVGSLLNISLGLLPLKLYFACLPEGTRIDGPSGTRPIETLRAGDLVTGYDGQPVRILQIHGYLEDAEATVFYRVSFDNGSDVDLCSKHRIGGVRAMDLAVGDRVTGGHMVTAIETYRGVERSYDLLTEDAGYRIGGVPVNSMIEEMHEAGQSVR